MKQPIDLEKWNRKEHFHFFKTFEEPFFGVTADVDIQRAIRFSKENNHSLFLCYLHCSLKAASQIPALTLRIENSQVYQYSECHASATIARSDGTFGFSFIPYHPDFLTFERQAKEEIKRVKETAGLFTRTFDKENLIHVSTFPRLQFTALSHARKFSISDSCPKITFGKFDSRSNEAKMPVAVHLHHALADGRDVEQFFIDFQKNLNDL
jgi:chloramphenicol O-acetyltransferase type A